jgi:hypothetical protein
MAVKRGQVAKSKRPTLDTVLVRSHSERHHVKAASARIDYNDGMIFRASLFIFLLLPAVPAEAQEQRAAAWPLLIRAETEEFLLKASIVSERAPNKYQKRLSLDDGKRKHDASVETEDGSTPSQRDYRFNVAAYELDKTLELYFVAPSVARAVNGRLAAVTWWVDDVAMAELERRKKKIEPPDPDSWNKQMHAVRVFDELISNKYRNVSPVHYLSTIWDNLLITSGWRIWLVDHTCTFRISKELENPESLTRCDRDLLRKLRELNRRVLKQKLGEYLTPEQLDGLEARRELLVKHFDEQITKKGEGSVLYDLPQRP